MKNNLSEVEKEIWVIAYKRALAHVDPLHAAQTANEALHIYEATARGEECDVLPLYVSGMVIYDRDEPYFWSPLVERSDPSLDG